MEKLFSFMIDMSITASVAAIAVIFIRMLLGKRLPRSFSYILWLMVLIRLIIPISIPSAFSLFNVLPLAEKSYAVENNFVNTYEKISSGASQLQTDNQSARDNTAIPGETLPEQDPVKNIIIWLWFSGAAGLLIFGMYYYIRTSCSFNTAVLYQNTNLTTDCSRRLGLRRSIKLYASTKIDTPLVCGLIRPRIILPLFLIKDWDENSLGLIVTHELVHIKRFDYIFKLLAVFALCIHWFNPVIWLSFILFHRDMESSCDERVIASYGSQIQGEYALALISLASKQSMLLRGGLLAFGENNIKGRIKGIIRYKKAGFWMSSLALAIIIFISLALITNGQNTDTNRRIEKAVAGYYLSNDPQNQGILKIYNIKKYGKGYLALTEKYKGDGESFSNLLLIDSDFNIVASSPGNMPISPCFSLNLVRDGDKLIMFGSFKNKKWIPATDEVVDVQISSIKIFFNDGKVFTEKVDMNNGYIIVGNTTGKIKAAEVYNNKGELQSNLNETFYTEYEFKKVVNNIAPFERSQLEEYFLENLVIHDSTIKDGPGVHYETIGNIKYGEIVMAIGRYKDWVLCSSTEGKGEFWIESGALLNEKYHTDFNLGIITADEVIVGTVKLQKGNLVQILKRDSDRSCATIRVIDVAGNKTGWIDNKDYTTSKSGVYFNQAYLRKGTTVYSKPLTSSQKVECPGIDNDILFVSINEERNGWVSISSFGPVYGWVEKKNIFIP